MDIFQGKYEEAVRRGQVWSLANQAAVAITAAFATTYTGLVVGNPTTSTKEIVMLGCSWTCTVAVPTATALGLMVGSGASVTNALTPKNMLVGSSEVPASIAWTEDSCTLPGTPVLAKPLATAWAEATTAGTLGQPNHVDLDGSIILRPGGFCAFYSAAANTDAFLFGFTWKEVKL